MDKVFRSFPKRRILVVGDMMLDHYISGTVHRISPEAPVPVVQVEREYNVAGGAANVAGNLASLGMEVELVGTVGVDREAEKLCTILETNGVYYDKYWCQPKTPTIVKTRIVAKPQQVCRVDRESASNFYTLKNDEDSRERLAALILRADAVVVSDYAKGVVDQSTYDFIIKVAASADKLVAVDPKPGRGIVYHGAGLLTPNRGEAFQIAGIPAVANVDDFSQLASRLHSNVQANKLLITLGADGMLIIEKSRVLAHLPTEAREVFDVSGAGDTVMATVVAGLCSGYSFVDAAKIANVAAGLVVAKFGTASVTCDELAAAITQET